MSIFIPFAIDDSQEFAQALSTFNLMMSFCLPNCPWRGEVGLLLYPAGASSLATGSLSALRAVSGVVIRFFEEYGHFFFGFSTDSCS